MKFFLKYILSSFIFSNALLASPGMFGSRDKYKPITTEQLNDRKWLEKQKSLGLTNANIIPDQIVKKLQNLPNLENLSLPKQIDDAAFLQLKNLPNLKALDLSFTSVTNKGISSAAGFSKLETLSLPAEVTAAGAKPLSALANLKKLDTRHDFDDDWLGIVGHFTKMEGLRIGGSSGTAYSKVSGTGLKAISNLKSLKWIGMRSSDLVDEDLQYIAQLPNLKTFSIQIEDRGPKKRVINFDGSGFRFMKARQFDQLTIEGVDFSNAGIEALSKLRAKTLNIMFCDLPKGSLKAVASIDGLNKILIDALPYKNSTAKDFVGEISYLENMAGLKELDLSRLELPKGATKYLYNLRSLDRLSLYGNVKIDESEFGQLASALKMKPNLKERFMVRKK